MQTVHKTRLAFTGALCLLALGLAVTASAQQGEPLKVGMSAAMTGPASPLGLGMRQGVQAAFAEQNAKGGVHGRQLELVAMDDGYEPSRTAPNMRALIDKEGVFAVLGNVGTPTAAVAVPIANEKKVPFWGAFTGAGLLRKSPPDRYIFNYRASYAEETAQIVSSLLDDLGVAPEEIGFFTQNDAYGDSGYRGAIQALQKRGYARAERLVHARYTRNTLDVEDGLSRLLDPRNQPKAVIMVGTAAPCARLIRLAREHGLDTTFIAVSFVGAQALLEDLGPELAQGVVVSQVVPHPEQSQLPAAQAFRAAVPKAEERSFVSFEGYLAARSFLRALEGAPAGADAEALIDQIESGEPWDLGLGKEHRLSAQEHQISHTLWPTVIQDGQIVPLTSWKTLRKEAQHAKR